jgi:parallel beta helix pectate lyase-like protein
MRAGTDSGAAGGQLMEANGERTQVARTIASPLSCVLVLVAYVLTMLALAAVAFTDVAAPHVGSTVARAAQGGGGPHCGQVVTHSITLQEDVTGCKFAGLVAGRSGITIDLNGHTVSGLGESIGIRVTGVRGVKVRNGTVRGFELGLLVSKASGSRFVNLKVADSADVGMRVLDTNRARYRHLTVGGSSDAGILIFRSNRGRFRHVNVSNNSDAGIIFEKSSRNSFRHVESSGNSDAGMWFKGGHGNRFSQVNASRNSDAGIAFEHSNRNRLHHIRMIGNGDAGVRFSYSHANRVRRSTAASSSDAGVSLDHSGHNVVAHNTTWRNGEGITVDGGVRNVIVRNSTQRNGGGGIEIAAESRKTLIGRNRSHLNLSDGIYIEGPETTVRYNHADCNGGMGIRAIPAGEVEAKEGQPNGGLIAHHNWAAGNNDDVGCMGVVCLLAASFSGCEPKER